jgi:exonuclease SbcC
MIQSLTLSGFQSHQDTRLDFDPGINFILGPSNVGKTAIIRALRFVTFNRPSGEAFINHDMSQAVVQITTDKSTITRTKSKKVNAYTLDGKKWSNMGAEVPEAVSAALNLKEINFQHQMDSPFLLADPPGQIARQINQAINLDLVDAALSSINRTHRLESAEIKNLVDEIAEAEAGLEGLEFVGAAEAELQAIESIQGAVFKGQKFQGELHSLVESKKNIEMELERVSKYNIEEALAAIELILGSLETLLSTENDLEEIKALLERRKTTQAKTKSLTQEYETTKQQLETAMPDICPTCGQEIAK